MVRKILILLLLIVPVAGWSQEEGAMVVMEGRVVCGRRGVPYATLQLKGTSIGVACNDNGEFTLKVPAGYEDDTLTVRSVGYHPRKVSVADILKDGTVKMRKEPVLLREVEVTSFRTPQLLIAAAVERIDSNYEQRTAWSTFFYRDWRAVDGELYLFDEAVMRVKRAAYSRYAEKPAYLFDPNIREMKSNYKSLLKHRLVIFDRELVEEKIGGTEGVTEKMGYADNEEFYDPVATPNASFALARGMLARQKFEPIQEYLSDDEVYYRLRSVGPGRIAKAVMRYEYNIRKRDLVIVSISAVMDSLNMPVGTESWINIKYDRMVITVDSSIWNYDVRCGKYTLTRYYNTQSVGLAVGDRWSSTVEQRWQQCVDWRLTDFSLDGEDTKGDIIPVKPQTVAGAFGKSDYSSDFWGQYNSITIDRQPAWLLYEKLKKSNAKQRKNE